MMVKLCPVCRGERYVVRVSEKAGPGYARELCVTCNGSGALEMTEAEQLRRSLEDARYRGKLRSLLHA